MADPLNRMVAWELQLLIGTRRSGCCFGADFRKHGARCASLAEAAGNHPDFILAALLHDVGSLLSPQDGDHALTGSRWLSERFARDISEPVRLHETALFYLMSTDPVFRACALRAGGAGAVHLDEEALSAFEGEPFWEAAVALAEIDVLSAFVRTPVPDFESFLRYLPVNSSPAGGAITRLQA